MLTKSEFLFSTKEGAIKTAVLVQDIKIVFNHKQVA